MGLQSLGLSQNATAVGPTGGTTVTFTPAGGVEVKNGIYLSDAAQTDFRIRRSITAKATMPVVNSLGEWSKQKNEVVLTQPKILANGKTVFRKVIIRVEDHPEASAVEAVELRRLAAQILTDSDTDNYWAAGSLA